MCCSLHATQKPNYSMIFGINSNSSFQHVSTIGLSRASVSDSSPRNAILQPNLKCTFKATKARNGLYLSVNSNSLLPAGSCVPFSFTLANEQHSPQTLTLTPIPTSTSILAGFMSRELCIQRPCIKCHSLFMPLHLFVLLYAWSLHIFPNCVPKALWTFKLFHEPQKRVSVLAEWQKPFFPQKLFWLLSLGLWNIVSLQDLFPPSGLRNLLLQFTLMGRNGRPHWTQISSPKPQRSY